jgi:hypothetical protein
MLSIIIKVDDSKEIDAIMAVGARDIAEYFAPECLKVNPRSVMLKNIPDGERYQIEWEEDRWVRDD